MRNWSKKMMAVMASAVMGVSLLSGISTQVYAYEEKVTNVHTLKPPVDDGVYYADVDLVMASDLERESMGNASLRGIKNALPDMEDRRL